MRSRRTAEAPRSAPDTSRRHRRLSTPVQEPTDRRPLRPHSIHHRNQVLDQYLDRWQIPRREPIRETGAPSVDLDHAAERPETVKESRCRLEMPLILEVRDETGDEKQIGAFAEDLEGNRDAITPDVTDVRDHRASLPDPRPDGKPRVQVYRACSGDIPPGFYAAPTGTARWQLPASEALRRFSSPATTDMPSIFRRSGSRHFNSPAVRVTFLNTGPADVPRPVSRR
jgi:hypothetical protein